MARDHYSNLPKSLTTPVLKTNRAVHIYANSETGAVSSTTEMSTVKTA